jgi:hypothetical protein
MKDPAPKQIMAKISRSCTEYAIVSLDRLGNVTDLVDIIGEITTDNVEILNIDDVITVWEPL